ncbi:hypothetical protein [Nocardioides okcheonensis]|uniref:hypothetical protein n=1 Tax=Nocardioides okcheonensis TaxID=2894081 RepID=UPI001E2BEA62|nr:hypothetical protein [Nocardioides okcheonensis]UFN44059.1 hypothetical protein LN652_18730 [Nocardioides okcheonensis]
MTGPTARGACAAVLALAVATGCSADASRVEPGHEHVGAGLVSMAVGDGTSPTEVGYSLDGLQVRESASGARELRFRIDFEGAPVTEFLEEQTKPLHLYVVDDRLEVFRHLHPTMAADGTWSVPLDVPDAGAYRVVAELVAVDDGGNGDHVVLGKEVSLPPGDPGDTVGGDDVVRVTVGQAPAVGPDGRLTLLVRDAAGRAVTLGTWLDAYGHVTGFDTATGAIAHLHPLDAPEVTADGTALTFHTDIEQPGDYRLFVQVRVDGFLHTVPVPLRVRPSA